MAYVGKRGEELARQLGEVMAENRKLKRQVDVLRQKNNEATIRGRGWVKKLKDAWERG